MKTQDFTKALALLLGVFFLISNTVVSQNTLKMNTLHNFTALTIEGDSFDFSNLKGKKVLIVNTASECGLTPQFESLEELNKEFGSGNFEIIGFPSNDFGAQDPGTNEEIASFCSKNYGVSFKMMSKISVKGEGIHPLYAWLTQKDLNGVGDFEVKWNFHKFLIDENGHLVKDIHPQTLPTESEIIEWITE